MKRLWLCLIPLSRRERVGLLTNEVFDRVGGLMLGNLLTSLVVGVGTYIWLMVLGVPYALLLALFVALFDLIAMIGSTIAGLVVTAVALTKGIPIGISTGIFYIVYRFAEDYVLNDTCYETDGESERRPDHNCHAGWWCSPGSHRGSRLPYAWPTPFSCSSRKWRSSARTFAELGAERPPASTGGSWEGRPRSRPLDHVKGERILGKKREVG